MILRPEDFSGAGLLFESGIIGWTCDSRLVMSVIYALNGWHKEDQLRGNPSPRLLQNMTTGARTTEETPK